MVHDLEHLVVAAPDILNRCDPQCQPKQEGHPSKEIVEVRILFECCCEPSALVDPYGPVQYCMGGGDEEAGMAQPTMVPAAVQAHIFYCIEDLPLGDVEKPELLRQHLTPMS